MATEVANPELDAALGDLRVALDAVARVGVAATDERDAIAVIEATEVAGRRMDAIRVAVVDQVDQQRQYRADGHASAKVMVRHVANVSDAEAAQRAKAAKMLRHMPATKAAFEAGRIGLDQVAVIARAYANPRIRLRVARQDEAFAEMAASVKHRVFEATVRDWVRRVDEDGTADRSQRTHENRECQLVQDLDGGWQLRARCGSVDGAQLNTILSAFIDAEFHTDWAKARAEHGDAATVDDLPRTAAQRRFDGLAAMADQAANGYAAAPGGSVLVTNLVMDLVTYERTAQRMAGASVDLVNDVALGGDDGFRCDTLDGQEIDPCEAVAASLLGHVRRVVVGADSVVIDLGRRGRLFTGPAQLAVKLSSRWCFWAGCYVPSTDCQSDHLAPWVDPTGRSPGGSTKPSNGGPGCGRHNRFKQRGFRVGRDPTGTIHIYRPDGTELR
jgi:hypothetical protein